MPDRPPNWLRSDEPWEVEARRYSRRRRRWTNLKFDIAEYVIPVVVAFVIWSVTRVGAVVLGIAVASWIGII
jgi:hypothetical protein